MAGIRNNEIRVDYTFVNISPSMMLQLRQIDRQTFAKKYRRPFPPFNASLKQEQRINTSFVERDISTNRYAEK